MSRSLTPWQATVLGLVVLVTLALGSVGLFLVGSRDWLGNAFRLRASFPDVSGVEVGTRVEVQGVDAGEVTEVQLEEPGQVVLVLHLKGRFRKIIRKGSHAQITSNGPMSANVIRIVNGKSAEAIGENALLPNSPQEGMFANLSTTTGNLSQVSEKLIRIVDRVDRATENYEQGKGPIGSAAKDLSQATKKLVTVVDRADQALREYNTGKGPIGSVAMELKQTTDKLDKVITEANKAVVAYNEGDGPVGKATADLRKATDKLNTILAKADVTIDNLQNGKGTLGKLLTDEKLYKDFTSSLNRIQLALANIEEGQGSLGKFLKDKTAYQETVKSLKDVRQMVSSVKQNSDAVKRLPIVRNYVVDLTKELVRPNCKRHRIVYPIYQIFEDDRATITRMGQRNLRAAGDWLNTHKEKKSEVVIAVFADPKQKPEFAKRLTEEQAKAVMGFVKDHHKIHRMGYWFWSNRRVKALGCGVGPTPVPEKKKLPTARVEIIVFVPE
ncbi:MAG: MlaD family protein [Gemmataceae bacterium]